MSAPLLLVVYIHAMIKLYCSKFRLNRYFKWCVGKLYNVCTYGRFALLLWTCKCCILGWSCIASGLHPRNSTRCYCCCMWGKDQFLPLPLIHLNDVNHAFHKTLLECKLIVLLFSKQLASSTFFAVEICFSLWNRCAAGGLEVAWRVTSTTCEGSISFSCLHLRNWRTTKMRLLCTVKAHQQWKNYLCSRLGQRLVVQV